MIGVLDDGLSLPGSGVPGDDFFVVARPEVMIVSADAEFFTDGPMGCGVLIAVKFETAVGMDFGLGTVPGIRQHIGERPESIGPEPQAGFLAGCSVDPDIGDLVPPLTGLPVDIVEIAKGSAWPEIVTNVVDAAFFDFSF